MKSQQLRKLAPELDSLRLGSGWKIDELSKPQIIVESSYGHSHPEAPIWINWWTRPESV